jgi:hypothetical protein
LPIAVIGERIADLILEERQAASHGR